MVNLSCLCVLLFCVVFSSCNSEFHRTSNIGFKKEIYENIKSNEENFYGDYVNPRDMRNYLHGSKKMVHPDRNNCPGTSLAKGCESCAVHMQRFVNLFLRATGLKDYVLLHSNSKRVHLDFIAEQEDLEVLQLFANTGNTDLAVINNALTNMLTAGSNIFEDETRTLKTEKQNYNEDSYFNSVIKPFFLLLLRLPFEFPQQCIAVCVTSVFGVTLWQVLNSRSWKVSLFSLLFLIFAAGFGWNWIRMYKIADAKRISSRILKDGGIGIPIYCQPDKMTWFEYARYYFTYEKDCEDYFKREMVDPLVEVSPTVVLAETISLLLLHPADKLGYAIGIFVSALLDAVPWPYKGIVVPIILVFLAVFVIIMGTLLIGKKLLFKIPFCSFEISSNSTLIRQERQFVEDIPSPPISGHIQDQPGNEIMYEEESTPILSKEKPRKEVVALFKKFKEIQSENGSGDKGIHSPKISVFKNNSDVHTAGGVSGNSPVHVHVHLPKCSGDDSFSCCKKDSCSPHLASKESDNHKMLSFVKSKSSETESDLACKNKEESNSSENPEFELITKSDMTNLKDVKNINESK